MFLHGVYGGAWAWLYSGGLHHVYENLRFSGLGEFVLVMPSDGLVADGSGYVTQKDANYEAWVVGDVLGAVAESFPSCGPESRHYIAGLSMGGYGALRLGCLYPEIFRGISAHSPITRFDEFALFTGHPPIPLDPNERTLDLAGLFEERRQSLPPFRFDVGCDDLLCDGNRQFHEALEQLSIPHEFLLLEGDHDWNYWHREVARSLVFFDGLEKQFAA